jgi:Tol biopolymer transport system component
VYSATDRTQQLFLMTADGSSTQQLTSDTLGDTEPIWRPDGSEIAFKRQTSDGPRCSLYTIKPDGTDLTFVHEFCAAGDPPPEGSMDWSPDGASIVYSSNLDTYQPHLYVLDLDTGDIVDLTPGDAPIAKSPSWSPDGGKIAYEGALAPFTPQGVMVLDLSTGVTVNLTPGEEARVPVWSSDGQRIAYFSGSASGNTLMTMRADGSDKASVVTVRDAAQVTWSPDDQYFAFENRVTINNSVTCDLLRVRTDGTGLTNLTNSRKLWEAYPDWNPNWENDL